VEHLEIGEMKLGDYVRTVLMMKEAEFGSRTIGSSVLLKHIDSLWRLLRDFTVVNPFSHIRPRYREKVDEKLKEKLIKACEHLDLPIILPLYKDMMMSKLNEDTFGRDGKLIDTLGYIMVDDVWLNELPWFRYFPEELENRHFLEAYKIMESEHTEGSET